MSRTGPADPGSLTPAPTGHWTTGRVVTVDRPAQRLVRIGLEVADRIDHLPGQHYVLRLRAEDGYTAQRSYSVASDPADPLLELMVECLPDGEVSGFLHDEVREGDVLELRGPIGGWFTWAGEQPAVCIAGGSGVVPIVAMLRHAQHTGRQDALTVVAVGRTRAELPYAEELLAAGAFVALTRENLTREDPTRTDLAARVASPPHLDEVRHLIEPAERAFVCGSTGFASFATRLLGEAGFRSDAIRVEQFGASG